MTLSIIIINYNTFQLTCDCIQSIKDTTTVDFEIILIDNNSKERAPGDFLSVFPDIKLILLEENVGFGRANNIGMEAAKGEYFLLLNSDTVVLENTVDETVKYMQQHTDVDVLGCRAQYPDGSHQLTVFSYGNELNIFSTIKFFFKKNSIVSQIERGFNYALRKLKLNGSTRKINYKEQSVNEDPVPNYNNGERIGIMMGVFLLIKKSVFEKTKGFDPDFFMYYEETEWFLKRLREFNLVYYPKVSIVHYYGKSDVYEKMNLQVHLSAYLFWYKLSYLHYFFFVIYNLFEVPSKALMGLLTFKKRYFQELKFTFKAFPYALFDIPQYSNAYGSRKEMLKLKYLKKKNL